LIDDSESQSVSVCLSQLDVRRGLEGERGNFELLRSACLAIGGNKVASFLLFLIDDDVY
jgi:hypothetical protein